MPAHRIYSTPIGNDDDSALPLGGPGSGNWGHAGRPGVRGGSAPRSSAMSIKSGRDWQQRYEQVTGHTYPYTDKDGKPNAVSGDKTQAFGNDPNTLYDFEYRVVSLDDLIPSNTDSGSINREYDATLQPRDRSRAASQAQIDAMARNMSPEALLWDFHQLDKGAPIVGEDMMVESGNGRTLALRRARDLYPDEFAAYQSELARIAEQYGLDPNAIDGVTNPVLVRVRKSDVDRAEFAQECNAPAVLQMSPLEQAAMDAGKIRSNWLNTFTVGEGQSIDEALRATANRPFVKNVMGQFQQNERATLMRSDGSLNRMGLWRIKAAVFSKVFPGEAGRRLADTFLESLDSNIKNFEHAIGDIMPKLAQAESMIASGQRGAGLSLASDISRAVDMLARLKETGLSVNQYVGQGSLWARETTPRQDRMMMAFDRVTRSRKSIRESLERYADAVIASPNPSQGTMFGMVNTTPEDLLNRMLEGIE